MEGERKSETLTLPQWRQLIVRSLNGETDRDLARDFGVPAGTIKQRRHSDPVWDVAYKRLREGLKPPPKEPKQEIKPVVKAESTAVSTPVQALPLSLADIATLHPQQVASYAHSLIQCSIEQGLIAPPTTASELKTLVEIIRKSCGLDDKSTNVSISFWSNSGASVAAPSAAPIREVEIVSQEAETDWI